MLNELFIFILALFLVIKGATLATTHAARLAEYFRLSRYTVGFIIVAVISILPETFIAINAALEGIPAFGLGTLFGSNVADLTLVLVLIVFLSGRSLKIESSILKNRRTYPLLLFLPLLLGFDGYYSRWEGATLIIAGGVFYYLALKNGAEPTIPATKTEGRTRHVLMLLFSMALLLIGSHFTVTSASALADYFSVNPVIIGLLVVGLGTTMPEFFFSLQSVKKRDDSLAVGDILGTVLADATVVVGILALIRPFAFPAKIVYVSGMFMVVAAFFLFHFMRSGRTLSRRETGFLLLFWVMFVVVEMLVNG